MLDMLSAEAFSQAHQQLRQPTQSLEDDLQVSLESLTSHGLNSEAETLVNDRSEVKYVMPMEVLPHFLPALEDEYSVLRFDERAISTYEITYFDTPELAHYHAHHNGHRNRYKYRLRRYADTGATFLEIKLKNNKGRTIKERFLWGENESDNADAKQRLHDRLGDRLQQYAPSLYVNYRRISFWNQNNGDRLTVDFDLSYQRPGEGGVRLPDIFVAEIKRLGKFHGSPFFRRAKSYGYFPKRFSKYCVGVCLTDNSGIKRNNFKGVLSGLGRVMPTGAVQQ